MRLADPLLGLIVLAALVLAQKISTRRSVRGPTLRFSDLTPMHGVSPRAVLRNRTLSTLRTVSLILLALAVARPQSEKRADDIITEGIDIMLALDISSTMSAEDFKPKNRLTVAKEVAADFIRRLRNDRVGLVVFARHSFTQCPLTLDYGVLLNFLDKVHIGLIEDATAIGMALATCVDRLKDSVAKSKIIVLLTDGENNAGIVDPITAAQASAAFGIRIYSVGVGSLEGALMPYDDPIFGRQYRRVITRLNEPLLQEIAKISGGKYFRATDKTTLEEVYRDIWQMEKTRFKVKEYQKYRELFPIFLLPALLLLAGEFIARQTIWLKLP